MVLLATTAAVAPLSFLQSKKNDSLTASVVLEGEAIAEYKLDILTGLATPVVNKTPYPLTTQAEPGRIHIARSVYFSQDYVRIEQISRAGQWIICLPDKLATSLSGSGSWGFDAING